MITSTFFIKRKSHKNKPEFHCPLLIRPDEVFISVRAALVEWRLLTNLGVTNLEQAARMIDWYRSRWEIEMFFHVLKNGCRIEALQLGCIDKLERALVLYMVVAWRIARQAAYTQRGGAAGRQAWRLSCANG